MDFLNNKEQTATHAAAMHDKKSVSRSVTQIKNAKDVVNFTIFALFTPKKATKKTQ